MSDHSTPAGLSADVVIRPLRAEDDTELREMHATLTAASRLDNPDRPIWSLELLTAMIRQPDDDVDFSAWVAAERDDASPSIHGLAFAVTPTRDNLQMLFFGVYVHPDRARRGIGSALLARVIDHAVAVRRTQVLTDSVFAFEARDDHGYRRFAERHGFQLASYEVSHRLELPVPDERLQTWIDEAASHHDGYRIATYSELPDGLLPSTCDVENQTAVDAPTGDIEFEAQRRTPEIRKRTFARDRESGVQTMETVAIADDRDVVAVTTLRIPEDDSGVMFQGTTIVAREHRGHRLGLAIKAANLQAAQRAFPGRKAVHTSNHETNASMVSINERLGFRPVELHVQFMREVDDASRV